jgi:hypothetical protein
MVDKRPFDEDAHKGVGLIPIYTVMKNALSEL